MLRKLKQFSMNRGSWLTLAIGALLLELIALFFQYVLGQKPCVLCVYQRAALAGVMIAGIVGVIAPKTPLRFFAIVAWISAAAQTLSLAWEQTQLQLHPSPFATCDFFPKFPQWLPLNQWFPSIFSPSGNCSDRGWTLFSMSMPQWLVGVSAVLLLLGVLVLLAQCCRQKR